MSAIFKKEFRSYFTSPIGYVILALLTFFAGRFFVGYNISMGSADLSGVFGSMFVVVLLFMPLVTMRLFSEEKRQKTDQALLTSPVSLTGIVLGKFFAALVMLVLAISILLVFAIIIAFQVSPDWSVVFGNFIGLLLVGGLIVSIGLLISSLTESQLIAAIFTIGVSFVLFIMDNIATQLSSVKLLTTIINFLSVSQRYNTFTSGIINYDNIIFFLSIQALVLFLTVRVLDSKRWS